MVTASAALSNTNAAVGHNGYHISVMWACTLQICTRRFRERVNDGYFMMDWTRLVSNSIKMIPKKLPRDCMLQGYMFATLRNGYHVEQVSRPAVMAMAGCRRPPKAWAVALSLSLSLSMYIYIYVYIYIYIYIVHIRISTHKYMYIHICLCVYICI